jgi:hypothetical protein
MRQPNPNAVGKIELLPVNGSRPVGREPRVVVVTSCSTSVVVVVGPTTVMGGYRWMYVVVVCMVDVTPPTDVDVAAAVVVVGGVVVVVVEVGGVVVEQLHDGCVGEEPCADAGIAKPRSAAPATPTTIKIPRNERPPTAPPPLRIHHGRT